MESLPMFCRKSWVQLLIGICQNFTSETILIVKEKNSGQGFWFGFLHKKLRCESLNSEFKRLRVPGLRLMPREGGVGIHRDFWDAYCCNAESALLTLKLGAGENSSMINNQPDFSSRGFLTRMWDLIPCLSFPKPFPSSHPCRTSTASKASNPVLIDSANPHQRLRHMIFLSTLASLSLLSLVLPRPPEMSRLSEFST